MKYGKVLCLGIALTLVMVTFVGLTASAIESEYILIDGETTWDLDVDTWGRYVVWRKALDKNSEGVLSWKDASWIMVHNINNGETYNITPADTLYTGDQYYHMRAPKVWNHKVIYYDTTGVSSPAPIRMYNITQNETWTPLASATVNDLAFYDNYILYFDTSNFIRLYDWETGIGKNLMPSHIQPQGLLDVNDKYAIFSTINAGSLQEMHIYNLSTMNKIVVSHISSSKALRVSSLYENMMAFYMQELSGDYDSYYIDLDEIDWDLTNGSYAGNPPEKTISITDIEYLMQPIDTDDSYNAYVPKIYGYNIAYETFTVSTWSNIVVYNYNQNTTTNITNDLYKQTDISIYQDKLVFTTNQNSDGVLTGNNHQDNFDVYRTLTEVEVAALDISAFIPVAIIVMFVGAIFLIMARITKGGDSF